MQIREQNLQDIKTAGPQSQVLTGAVVDRTVAQVSVPLRPSASLSSCLWVVFNCAIIFWPQRVTIWQVSTGWDDPRLPSHWRGYAHGRYVCFRLVWFAFIWLGLMWCDLIWFAVLVRLIWIGLRASQVSSFSPDSPPCLHVRWICMALMTLCPPWSLCLASMFESSSVWPHWDWVA